jgi:hypothetical protein
MNLQKNLIEENYICTNMRKLTYLVIENNKTYGMEFISDRTAQWTETQYMRHRKGITMELISDEETEEKEPVSREVDLG